MRDVFEKLFHPQEGLNIVEFCPNRPENYNWQSRAWFNGRTHPIRRTDFQIIDKGRYTYQIEPFVFEDEIAPQATGAHFFIPGGRPNNIILFTDRKYHWRTRAVSGSGWILAYHSRRGVLQSWLSPDLEKNPVIEFGKNWTACLIASPNCGQFVVEGIDRPEYIEGGEKLIGPYEENSAVPAAFWTEFDRLTAGSERARLMDSGR